MKLDRIALGFKIGDGSIKNTMPVDYIDERKWRRPLEKILSSNALKTFAYVIVDRDLEPYLKQILNPVGCTYENGLPKIPDVSKFRPRGAFLPFDTLEIVTGIPFLKKDIEDKDKVVSLIDARGKLKSEHFKDSLLHETPALYDFNAITGGTATIGAGGIYPTRSSAFSDVGSLTANLKFVIISSTIETSSSTSSQNLNGYTFTLTSNWKAWGNPTKGHTTTRDYNHEHLHIDFEGSGAVIIEHQYFKTTVALTSEFANILMWGNSGTYPLTIRHNMINQGGRPGRGVVTSVATSQAICYNNKVWGGVYGSDSRAFYYYQQASGSKSENNSAKDFRWLFDCNNQSTITLKNDVGVDPATLSFYRIGSCNGYNTASTDTSNANGNWGTGSGNQTSINKDHEFITLNDTNKYFFKVYQGGVCYNGGTTPSITENTIGERGNSRPYSGTNYSIGADEYRIDMFFSVGTSTADKKTGSPTVSITDAKATFSAAQTGNIGVGDEIDYDTDNKKAYIISKLDTSNWIVRTATGAVPSDISSKTVNAIKRAFGDGSPDYHPLEHALHGSTPQAGNSSHLNTQNLVGNNIRLFIACYAETNDDRSLVDLNEDVWTVNSDYYLYIYTPIDTGSESNQSQRHNGTINGGGYKLKSPLSTDYRHNIFLGQERTKIEGLFIERTSSNWSYGAAIRNDWDEDCQYSEIFNCLFYQLSGGSDNGMVYFQCANTENYKVSFHDNFLISESTSLLYGLHFATSYQPDYIYNNTFYGKALSAGIRCDHSTSGGKTLCKNNYSFNTGSGADYTFPDATNYPNTVPEFAYNGSEDTTAGTSNNNKINLTSPNFVSVAGGSENLHIKSGSDLIGQGIGPESDSKVSAEDIDGDFRSGTICDMGADEFAVISAFIPGMQAMIVPHTKYKNWINP